MPCRAPSSREREGEIRLCRPRRSPPLSPPPAPPLDWRPLVGEAEHAAAVAAIRAAIAAGDTYQANFTFPLEAAAPDDPFPLFLALDAAQRGRHAAFLDLGERARALRLAGALFRREGEEVTVRPMKGTARRGRFPAEDAAALAELRSEKNRAENLMIVDMMRNDLGKVALPGSVQVSALFAAETYPTVHQLVSEVRAKTAVSQVELLRALFPCASITGAPKASTQAILRDSSAGRAGSTPGRPATSRRAGGPPSRWRSAPSPGNGGREAGRWPASAPAAASSGTRTPPPNTANARPRPRSSPPPGRLRAARNDALAAAQRLLPAATATWRGWPLRPPTSASPATPKRSPPRWPRPLPAFRAGRCRVRLLLAEDGACRVEATA